MVVMTPLFCNSANRGEMDLESIFDAKELASAIVSGPFLKIIS
jgi:hypothetical protein